MKLLPARKVAALPLSKTDAAVAHMAASILLDYPSEERRARFDVVAESVTRLPHPLRTAFETFLAAADAMGRQELEMHFIQTFDTKRKCCPYLSYYAAGDTRRRGMALVRFIEAYRAAGWEPAADELPDYLPMVLEFSALSDSPIAGELLSAHRDGIEVLRTALETIASPYAHVLEAVSLSLPKIDEETRQRYLALVNEGPPAETVGLTFLGNLAPFGAGATNEGARR